MTSADVSDKPQPLQEAFELIALQEKKLQEREALIAEKEAAQEQQAAALEERASSLESKSAYLEERIDHVNKQAVHLEEQVSRAEAQVVALAERGRELIEASEGIHKRGKDLREQAMLLRDARDQLVATVTRARAQVRLYQFREGITQEGLAAFSEELEAAVVDPADGPTLSVEEVLRLFRAMMARVEEGLQQFRECPGEATWCKGVVN